MRYLFAGDTAKGKFAPDEYLSNAYPGNVHKNPKNIFLSRKTSEFFEKSSLSGIENNLNQKKRIDL